ncbi:hypothetical protein TWF173_008488 [Orbilia oligospora]|uniref:Uncharacterized protein n=1 Tax=Arthrobotrys oligospora (strain ATCC 24927 / CBS 115.81 / DSM 1491) TaxID=756982 RepID=G1WZK3_ARTOA|nr:hypothetical protein AOL_s00006g54 [Orbilia oligospora ATCC 24927]EGX53664.1 hypothetical protein AOL_s00006g54 [Orbilia oligospora ATCC 24927]KAF3311347.1 hypothetical protein TWF173_008488 [Orbilia oligospora]
MLNASWRPWVALLILLFFAVRPTAAFGAGNIASISKIEGKNFRHGDIEDILKALLFLKGGKWTSKQVKRVYFGNWLRDYSQALDVGTLKGAPAGTIRVLVAVLAFLSFGYATEEFEVTDQRLGVYRPEEHIDNPKNYADNLDARAYDPRLRPPVVPVELAVDPETGMKNYIANERGGWATSAGYIKYSLDRSIHFGRMYTSGAEGLKGNKEDLCEALRCLGQALHTMEDFSAHSNYCELVLKELGIDAFPHVGTSSHITLTNGRRVFPLVTGTFGSTDFLHSVLGEAQDKLTQNELEELDLAMAEAQEDDKKRTSSSSGTRGFGSSGGGSSDSEILKALLSQIPGTQGLGDECSRLQADADAQRFANMDIGGGTRAGYGSSHGGSSYGGSSYGGGGGSVSDKIGAYNPEQLMQRVWPILQFRDRVFRAIESAIEKVPGLVDVVEKISELLSVFIFSLLAPILRPVIEQVALELKKGSNGVLDASAHAQFEPWNDPFCTDPTHSLLSKDHFSNRLNEPAGLIAQAVVKYVVPRIVFAWENPNTPVTMVLDDVVRVFHHPACRDPRLELHTSMFKAVQDWVNRLPDKGSRLNVWLSSEGVRTGKNHTDGVIGGGHDGGHGKVHGSDLDKAGGRVKKKKKGDTSNLDPFAQLAGAVGGQPLQNIIGSLLGGGAAAGLASEYSGKSSKKDKYKDYDYDYAGSEKKEKKKDKYDDYDRDRREKKSKDYDYERSEKKKHKSSKDKKEKVKDDDYYRRKAERRARKEREREEGYGERKQKHKHRSRAADGEGEEDSDSDSDDSALAFEERPRKDRRKSRSSKDRDYDEPYKSSRALEEEGDYSSHRGYEQPSYSRDLQGSGYGYAPQPTAGPGYYGGESGGYGAPAHGGYEHQGYGSMPGGFPSEQSHHGAPYPTGNAQPFNFGSGYVIGSDGQVGRDRDYDHDYTSGRDRDINYPDESAYGAPPPPQDFGYVSGGYGDYSGGASGGGGGGGGYTGSGYSGHEHRYGY